MTYLRSGIALSIFLLGICVGVMGQDCVALGQNPRTAFPVCGTTAFHQTTVPICSSNDLFVPGCAGTSAAYANKNPYWYKFTCYQSGSLGFLITPNDLGEDYDWQLYDVTGRNPNDVYFDPSLVIIGNWSGSYGLTGASADAPDSTACASVPADDVNTFTKMPQLVAGHDYLLLISHFSDSQSGYSLSFGGGTAVITDPTEPHLMKALPNCDGTKIIVKLNKKMKCNSLTAPGTEFSLSPAVTTVLSASAASCSTGFDLDELTITLASPLPDGNYQLIVNHGSDGNTIKDNCDREIPPAESLPFTYTHPIPTPVDSIGSIGCSPSNLRLYFSKRIQCSSIAPDGSDFAIAGPAPVTITGAAGICTDGLSDIIMIQLASPITSKGNFTLTVKAGTDGTTVIDECGLETLTQSLPFNTVDTVSAEFNFTTIESCRFDTVTFTHDGAHDVNSWNWIFNQNTINNQPVAPMVFPASSSNTIQLIVSNGVCSDSSTINLTLDNETKALFNMPDVICPEDPLIVTDSSSGEVDSWTWKYDGSNIATGQSPPPYFFLQNNQQAYHSVQLVVSNSVLNCKDSLLKRVLVLNNCFIAVPTAFTPDGDGLNDNLSPHNALKAGNLEFRVFNRWGQLMFVGRSWLEKWDGTYKGLPQPAGIYVWFLRYTRTDNGQQIFQKGTTMLIR